MTVPRRRVLPVLLVAPVAAVAAVLLALGATAPAYADPQPEPGPNPGGQATTSDASGPADTAALADLQKLSAQVQQKVLDAQSAVTKAQQDLEAQQAEADAAAKDLATAREQLADRRAEVGRYAAALYVGGPQMDVSLLVLSPGDIADKLERTELVAFVDDRAAEVIAQATAAQDKAAQIAAAQQKALAQVKKAYAQVTAAAADVADAATAAGGDLDQALGTVDQQYQALAAQQRKVDLTTQQRWTAYLQRLQAGGVTPPPAAQLLDPAALPTGLAPLAGSTGPQRGVAVKPGASSSLLVLPAEAVEALTTAIDALGKPYAAGGAGPSSYDCTGLVRSVYPGLPVTVDEQFAVLAPVAAADVQPGDLVFLGSPQAGLHEVGLVLDPKTFLAADGAVRAVAVRPLPTATGAEGRVYGFARPRLTRRAPVAAPKGSGGGFPVRCGAVVYPSSYAGSKGWGGYPNGLIPPSALCPLGVGSHRLRCDAAAAYRAMSSAYAQTYGGPLCITDSYRSFSAQVALYAQKPALAAVPGTSNHGWGLAVDLCGGIQTFGTPQYRWMKANAGRFGWIHPSWAEPGSGREEPWHWEYAG